MCSHGGQDWQLVWFPGFWRVEYIAGTQAADISKQEYQKLIKSAVVLWQLCWLLLLSSLVKAAGVFCRTGHREPYHSCCVAAIGRPCIFPLVLAFSTPLSFASMGRVTSKWELCGLKG